MSTYLNKKLSCCFDSWLYSVWWIA